MSSARRFADDRSGGTQSVHKFRFGFPSEYFFVYPIDRHHILQAFYPNDDHRRHLTDK
jgi:hypothetical protein